MLLEETMVLGVGMALRNVWLINKNMLIENKLILKDLQVGCCPHLSVKCRLQS